MKFSKKLLLGLSAICMLSLCALPNALNDSNNFSESTNLRNAVGIKLQATNNDEGLVEVSETFVQTGLFVDDKDVTHNYLRFATAINLSNNNGISSLEYVRKVGDNEKAIEVKTVYKKLSAENNNYYSYNGEELTTDEVSNDWYFACYTVDIQSEEYKSKDFKLSLRVNNKEVYAYTAASLNTLNSNHYLARFENEGELLGKQFVSDNVAPTYLGEELTKEADDHTYTFGWDKEFAPVTEDVTYNVEFIKNHNFGEATRNVATATVTEALYDTKECTIAGCEEAHRKEVGYVLQAEHAQRLYLSQYSSIDNNNHNIRLATNGLLEFTFFSEKETDANLYLNLYSRGGSDNPIPDTNVKTLYKITHNDSEVTPSEDSTLLTSDEWGSKWGIKKLAKYSTIHLTKGLNIIMILSNNSNTANIDYVQLEYLGDTTSDFANLAKFAATESQTIYFNPDSQYSGIYGPDKTNYISVLGSQSSVRLNTSGDYIEYSLTSDKDVNVALAMDITFRSTITESSKYKQVLDCFSILVKEGETEYREINTNDDLVYDQSVYSTKTYGEFHRLRVCELSFKAGMVYTFKISVKTNLHIDQMFFAHTTDAVISAVK